MDGLRAGQIVIMDSHRPCVVVEDAGLFDPLYPNVLVVPLADDQRSVIPSLAVTIEPSAENGRTATCYAASHCITTASKKRIAAATPAHLTDGEISAIRRQIAESLGL